MVHSHTMPQTMVHAAMEPALKRMLIETMAKPSGERPRVHKVTAQVWGDSDGTFFFHNILHTSKRDALKKPAL